MDSKVERLLMFCLIGVSLKDNRFLSLRKRTTLKSLFQKRCLGRLWERLYEEVGAATFQLFPFGAKMSKISESDIPFTHRVDNLYQFTYLVRWDEDGNVTITKRHLNWTRSVYGYMTPYVTNNPRGAYLNSRDLDLGRNNNNGTAQASTWGRSYFKDNFDRLVHVKTKVDPTNFFRNEQSIPPLPSREKERGD
ncbi:tetrahydrocannabinolic acid synthase-like [Morus notabilis]|uniref:tetrahydrocannabinolic acid synthase-like n=1 Tax=Morus notabilis TaxID=981085 RepID=UPI000CED33EF|nr:tetrahydrocannabinolic acid synthase-like [Morus notabilis]